METNHTLTDRKLEIAESIIKVSLWKITQLRRDGNHPRKIKELERVIQLNRQFIKYNTPDA